VMIHGGGATAAGRVVIRPGEPAAHLGRKFYRSE